MDIRTEAIAIVGMGCRFAGADGLEAMWRLLYDGVDAITEVPRDRFDIDALYDARPSIPGKLITRWGGFLKNHDQFDASFFGISPREASASDPQHRLLLEVAWESLEDAGLSLDKLAANRTGVFLGIITGDYWDLQARDPEGIDIYATTGNHRSVAAGRISWALGLQGPSLAVDTACSSSLVAIHLACQSLRSGESSVALAGGVNLVLQPEASLGFSHARMLAPDGRCKFGDASGNGFVRSDGVGFLVLKPLGRALEDGDRIYAVIRGSAVNNDGNTSLMMTPSPVGQEAVLRAAYQDAGVDPATVQYVEAHGTGTKVGDPVELSALAAVLGPGRTADRRCLVGSVKTNIGHPEGAAGVAGVIKTVLALSHRTIPASLHLKEPNPAVPWDELPLAVARETAPWPASTHPARAGVSSFGISGTNAHVVLEAAPPTTAAAADESAETDLLLPLSARSPEALRQLAERWRGFLPSTPEPLRDVVFTAGARRTHHEHRLALVGRSREELSEKLAAYLDGEARAGVDTGSPAAGERPRVVFVFPGQGSQWIGMGRELWEREPVFRQALERCADAIEREAGWSLRDVLLGDGGQALLQEVDVIQPALFAMQVSLAALWRSWGVEPAAVIGQSMGEVAAACVAGGLDLEDAVRVICRRSSLVKQTSRGGAMAVVDLPLREAQAALAGEEERLSIAVSSSPRSTVLSGEAEAMDRVLAALGARGVFCRLIKVDYASHSPYMDPLRDELTRRLEGLRPRASEIPLFSTVTAGFQDGAGLDPEYWWNNLRQPVLFSTAVERLAAAGHDVFLEVSPHPLLPTPIQQTLQHVGHGGLALASLRREEPERGALLATLGTLWTRGCPVDWARLSGGGRVVSLPPYPWQRERFWHEERRIAQRRVSWERATSGPGSPRLHPMLGERLDTPLHPGTHVWSFEIATDRFPWLEEHRVQGAVVLPAAAYLEMVLAMVEEIEPGRLPELERIAFRKALFLKADEPRQLQLAVIREISGAHSFRFYQHEAADGGAREHWTLLCEGSLRALAELPRTGEELAAVRARCTEEWTADQHYALLSRHGIDDGPAFRGVERLWRGPGEALAEVRAQGSVPGEAGRYRFHPALLDGCFQALLGLLPGGEDGGAATYLPVALGELRLHRRPDPEEVLWSHAALLPENGGDGQSLLANLRVMDAEGRPVLDIDGFRFQSLAGEAATSRSAPDDWFFRTEWRAAPRPSRRADRSAPPGTWIVLADEGGAGGRLARELESQGESCLQVRVGETFRELEGGVRELDPARPEDFSRLLDELHAAGVSRVTGVLHLWSLDAPGESGLTPEALQEAQTRGCGAALHMVQALVQAVSRAQLTALPRLWLVTREAQAVEPGRPVAVAQAPLWGLGRALFYEHPELRTVRVDLGPAGDVAAADEARELLAELGVEEVEDEVALRGAERFVHRLVRRPPVQPSAGQAAAAAGAGEPAGDRPYRLETLRPGQLENLVLRAAGRPAPGPGQIEIRVRAAGLNFINVLSAMGIYPGVPEGFKTLGLECAGTVTAVGPGVEEWQPGDEVIALAHDTMATHVLADARMVARRPAAISAEEGASFGIAFCTAEYALGHLGRLAPGERVLIHAAAGGVGLAAVQLAQRAGAEIFATAGSEEKRELLRSLGVEHVMDSRSLDFADEVLRRTGGEGVDLVLNSLAGEAQLRGLALLRPYGRFLELGKRDLFEGNPLSLQPFQRSLSFAAVDLERMMRDRVALLGGILRRLVADLGAGSLRPLPTRVYPASQAAEAFREMAQARHVGKLAVSFEDPGARLAPTGGAAARFRSDGSYLLTGGLGAIGLAVARWMAERGAGHLVLVGRGAPSAEAEAAIAGIEAAGARVTVARADVSRKEEVAAILSGWAGLEGQPPLRGVVHAAGLLDDSILLQMDLARWNRVMAPKVLGAWNLHVLTRGLPLDLFVLFSSAAALVGSPGQGNYVASNEFLDALACHRRALGLPGLSIGWGPWSEIGLAAARSDRGARLAERGLGSFSPEQGLDALGRLLVQEAPRFGVMRLDVDRWSEFYPAARQLRLFDELRSQGTAAAGQPVAEGGSLTSRLRPLAPVERLRLLQDELSGEIARVLRLSATRIDPRQPIKKLGLDSLMAVELKNRIETDFGVSVPIVRFLQGLNLEDLSDLVLEGLEVDDAVETPPPAPAAPSGIKSEAEQAAHLLARLDQLSDQEVEALLRDLATEEGTQA